MTWATLAITVMGGAFGLDADSAHAYLLGAMILCVGEFWARNDRLTLRYIMQITMRYAAVVVIAWAIAIALSPWLQTGNP